MRSSIVLMLLFVVACTDAAETTTTSTTVASTTTSSIESTSTTAPPAPCPPAPYDLTWLPPAVRPAADDDAAEPDDFTSIGGTHVRLWVNRDGEAAIALVRGSLPPQEWPADRGEVDVAGARAVAGPYPDGRWVVAWFNEPGDRCDQYMMVFYPPVSPAEVEETLANMERLPG